jgi:hypothetical protein
VVILFPGDQLPDSLPTQLLELQDPLVQVEGLQQRFPLHTDFLVVFPSQMSRDGFSRYDQFLVSSSPTGEPSQYIGNTGRALAELRRIIDDHCQRIPAVAEIDDDDGCRQYRVDVVGFSKGGVVVNQIIAEMGCEVNGEQDRSTSDAWQWAWRVLRGLHYVDAGLNSPGAYICEPEVIRGFSATRQQLRSNLFVTMTGTWRQWAEASRPWIRREADELFQLLRLGSVPVRQTFIGDMTGEGSGGTRRQHTPLEGLEVHLRALAMYDPSPPSE